MNSRFEIVVNLELRVITVFSDDPQLQDLFCDLLFVCEHAFIEEIPEMVYALKHIREEPPYSYRYRNSVLSLEADCNCVRAHVLFDCDVLNFEFDRQLFIDVLSDYAVKFYQHKEVLLPFCHIRDLSDVQHLLK